MTIKFVLKDGENTPIEYSLKMSDTISDLKIMIVTDRFENNGSVNIDLLLERARRSFGKFNLEPGIFPNSLDKKMLNDFALNDGETINIKAEHIDILVEPEVKQELFKKISNNSGAYVPPYIKNGSNKSTYNSQYNKPKKVVQESFVYQEDEFPSL